MLNLKLQYSGHLMQKTDSLEKYWCWERLKVRGEGDNRGWDGWMVSSIRWTWVWVSFGSWWWTGKPGMLQPTGSQRVGHNWGTEPNWTTGGLCPMWHCPNQCTSCKVKFSVFSFKFLFLFFFLSCYSLSSFDPLNKLLGDKMQLRINIFTSVFKQTVHRLSPEW